jgi:hypothetical protein
MARHYTVIGDLFVRDRERAIAEIIECLLISEGNVCRAAPMLGISRRQLHRMIACANLGSVVNEIRRQRIAKKKTIPEWLKRTRKVLHG